MGRHDQQIRKHERIKHVTAMTAAVAVPMNVDSERLFAHTSDQIAAATAGCSIEDFDPLRVRSIRLARSPSALRRRLPFAWAGWC